MNKLQVVLCSLFLASASISQSVDIFHEISKGSYKAIHLWVRSKPDLSIRNAQGQSILHMAVLSGKKKMVSYILRHRFDVNALDNNRKTALDVAIDHGNKDIIFELVYKKALVTTIDNQKYLEFLFQKKFQERRMIHKIFLCVAFALLALLISPLPCMYAYRYSSYPILTFLVEFILVEVLAVAAFLVICPPLGWLLTVSLVKYIYDSYHLPNYYNKVLIIDHALAKEY